MIACDQSPCDVARTQTSPKASHAEANARTHISWFGAQSRENITRVS